VQKGANKKVAATRDFDGSGQQALTASSQPATHELSATVSPSTSPPAAKSLPASNKLWGLIPDQSTGVAGMVVSFRCASAIFLNKFHTRPPKAHHEAGQSPSFCLLPLLRAQITEVRLTPLAEIVVMDQADTKAHIRHSHAETSLPTAFGWRPRICRHCPGFLRAFSRRPDLQPRRFSGALSCRRMFRFRRFGSVAVADNGSRFFHGRFLLRVWGWRLGNRFRRSHTQGRIVGQI